MPQEFSHDGDVPRPTIAVVAVHGVGDYERGASARAVADLLLRIEGDPGERPTYTAFQEMPMRIPTKPAFVGPRSRPHTLKRLRRSIFTEQSDYLRTQQARRPDRRDDRSADLPEHQFMRAQLEQYESSGQPYDTVRLSGERRKPTGEHEADLHVYEMFWADMSQIGSDGVKFFGALYQLLFHLAHLGRVAVDHALIEFRRRRVWRAFRLTQQWSVRMLTVFIPDFWLVMIATILGGIVLQISDVAKPAVVVFTFGCAMISLSLVMAYRASDAGRVRVRPVFPMLGIVLTAIVAGEVFSENRVDPVHAAHINRALLGAWMLLAGGLLHLILREYERVRPGARMIGLVSYAFAAVATLAIALPAPNGQVMFARVVHVFEIETAVIMGTWYLLYAFGAASGLLGIIAQHSTPKNTAERARARDVVWTARTTLAASASMVLMVTFVMWAAVLATTKDMLPKTAERPWLPMFDRGASTYGDLFGNILRITAGPGFTILLGIISVIAIVGIVALLPAVIKDVFPSATGERFRRRATGRSASDHEARRKRQLREDDASQKLGGWVTGGLGTVGLVIGILFVAMFVLMPALNIVDYLDKHQQGSLLEDIEGWAGRVILAAGGSLTAAAVGLVAFRHRLDALALGFRPAVDAALDIDNYLREHPRSSTPRARIAERYTSLLRHLCNWRDVDGKPYSAIILVAHSQGGAISAELLNFIQREPDPELEPLRHGGHGEPALYLFTMGNPLRQLYANSFPHLFGWVRGDLGDWFTRRDTPMPPAYRAAARHDAPSHVVSARLIPSFAAPHPWELGATRWVNAYRSGDYVGRSLWRADMPDEHTLYRCAPADQAGAADAPTTIVVSEDAERSRRELCIGIGAHTHYWDSSSKAIALELNLLIAEATENAVTQRAVSGAQPQSRV